MSDPHVFPDPRITVTWSKRRCIHSAECVRGLPDVFEPGRKPWIIPGNSAPESIARVIQRCPTGALQFQRHDGGATEVPDSETTVRVSRNGPLYLRGALEVATGAGPARETRAALCRCGQSGNKPYCDGSHNVARFRDAGEVGEGRVEPLAPGNAPRPLRIIARASGPLRLLGPFTLVSDDGHVRHAGSETALCRCGQSRNKPFCDSSHKVSGFAAPALGEGGA